MAVVVQTTEAGGLLGDEAAVALRPSSTYRALIARAEPVTWWRALERPALVLLVLGTALPITGVGRVTVGLVLTTTVAWTFALAVQLVAALALIASAPRRRIALPAALHLFYAGHLPWSLWLLSFAALTMADAPLMARDTVLHSVLIPIGWTAIVMAAFCREVLGDSRWVARVRTAAHQVLIYGFVLVYAAWAAGGWFRLFG